VRLDFILFCGAAVQENSPDHATIRRFRNALAKLSLNRAILKEVNHQPAVRTA